MISLVGLWHWRCLRRWRLYSPGNSATKPIPLFWAAVYLVVALFYGFEGNYVTRWGTAGMNAFQVMLGASAVGLILTTPLMIWDGQFIAPNWPLGRVQGAHLVASVVHVLVYASYVWLVSRAGAVFGAQVSYLVTGFGLIWAWMILQEGYAPTLWIALAAMFAGMYFVQPGPQRAFREVRQA